jgi:monoamine oxidase
MARTPLLRSLRALFRDLRVSRATGIPMRELPERRDELRPRRREILKGAAAAVAGATILGALARQARAAGQPTIAIVGGGIAGLACGLRLADRGIAATVYEGSARIGGRMFSNNRGYWADGQVSEWCGELIDTGHTTIQGLARRFGLPLDNLPAGEARRSTDTFRFFDRYFPTAQADADFLAIADALDRDVNDAPFPTTFDSFTPAGQALDRMSIFDWIESRVPGGHQAPLGALLDTAYNIEYGADTTVQSSLNLLYLLGFQPDDQHLAVFGESDEAFHIRGGNQLLPQAMAAALGDAVVTGWRLARVAKTPAGRVRLVFDVAGGGSREVVADLAVLAIPFAVLRDLDIAGAGFGALKRTAIQDLGRGHSGKLQLQFDRRLWTQRGPWGISTGTTYADTGYQSSWEASRAQPGASGIIVFYSGGSVTDGMATAAPFATIGGNPQVAADARRALAQVTPVFPGLARIWNDRATQSLPHKFDFMKASYSYWRVGQYTTFAGIEGEPEGNVFFCGEHTSQDFQGFMEGGASTGQETASEIAHLLRRG